MTNTYEARKKAAAREVWPKRDKRTPSGKFTWRVWWNKTYSDDLDDYAKRNAK